MANVINAITSGTGGLSTTADASGNIDFKSNGTTVASITSSGLNVVGTFTNNGSPINVSGGATTTSSGTDITLTSSSNKVQNVSLTANYLSVILPSATTLTGGATFIINNTGNFSFFVKANGGAILYWLGPQTTVTFTVSDVSTAQGKWIYQTASNYGPKYLGQYLYSGMDTNSANNGQYNNPVDSSSFVIQPLTSTTMFIAWKRYSNNSIYGVVATNSSGTLSYGTVTLLYDGSSTACTYFAGRSLSSTNLMMTFDTASGAIAKGITVSGTTISVSTAAAAFGSPQSNWTVAGIAAMDSTNCLVTYFNSASVLIARNLVHNGASAPTLSTVSSNITMSAAAIPVFGVVPLTSTTAQIWYPTTGGATAVTVMSTRIVTISGSSAPTLGTAVTYTVGNNQSAHVTGSYSATETFAVMTQNNAQVYGWSTVSFSISGTTITVQNNRTLFTTNTNSLTPWSAFTKVDSTTYISISLPYFGIIAKYNYITGGNLYATGTSDYSIMAGQYGGAFATYYNLYVTPGGASTVYNTSNTQSSLPVTDIIPSFPSAIQMFSGSSTTGIIVGFGLQNTTATSATSVAIPIANVFTIL